MKKILCLLFAAALVLPCAFADEPVSHMDIIEALNLSEFSDEELAFLRSSIDEEAASRFSSDNVVYEDSTVRVEFKEGKTNRYGNIISLTLTVTNLSSKRYKFYTWGIDVFQDGVSLEHYYSSSDTNTDPTILPGYSTDVKTSFSLNNDESPIIVSYESGMMTLYIRKNNE